MGESTPSRINRAARSASRVPYPCQASIVIDQSRDRGQLGFQHRVAKDDQINELHPYGGKIDERLLGRRDRNPRSEGSTGIDLPKMGLTPGGVAARRVPAL